MSTTPIPPTGSPTEPHDRLDPAPERRVALVPVLIAVAGLIIAAVLTTTIIGLATQGPPPVADASSAPPTAPVSSAPAPSPTEVAAAPRPEPGPGECVDALGDGGTVDLDTVSVAVLRDEVVARFTLDTPPTGETLLGITATGRDRTVLLAVRLVDGAVDEVFAVALAAPDNGDDDNNRGEGRGGDDDADVDGFDERRATLEGRDVTVTFPDDVVDDLGRDWSWSATSSNGESGDRCPAEGQQPSRG